MDEWMDEKYRCDNCGEDGAEKYYDIQMRGWPLFVGLANYID